jgi:UPF0042 nucleotide-binding protein
MALDSPQRDEVILITGISGSGKSVALHALEDAGYFCVDNLPPELLRDFIRLEHGRFTHRVAEGVQVRPIFLDASTDALVRRFSETRRPHPLTTLAPGTDGGRALVDAIQLERDLLADLREVSTVIDTSQLRPSLLRSWVRSLVGARMAPLTVVFESFAFKNGVPLDADFVFDVRVLPNPYYLRELRPLTGRDAPVAAYLERQPEVDAMISQVEAFLQHWLPAFENDQRSYLTVAIGCTGGQHRSVYCVETLAHRFEARHVTLIRHRELDARA